MDRNLEVTPKATVKVRPIASRMHRNVSRAEILAQQILEIRNVAKEQDYQVLQGFLEMAYCEAFSLAHPIEISAAERKRLRQLEQVARNAIEKSAA